MFHKRKVDIYVTESKPLAQTHVQVRYHECDPSGIVFHPHYLTWADMASFDCLHAMQVRYSDLTDQGVELVVADSSVRYRSPCTSGDVLIVSGFLNHVGTTSMVLRFEMHKNDSLVAEVTNRYVWVSNETMRPTAPPEDIGKKLAENLAVA